MAVKKTKSTAEEKSSTILYRSETNKVLGGVCGGLGEVFKIDPTIIRVLFVLAILFGGSGLLFYIVLWAVIPSRSKVTNTSDENIRENIDEMKERVHSFSKDFTLAHDRHGARPVWGMFILILGLLFLLGNFGYVHLFNVARLWPLFLIIIGFLMLSRKTGRP